MPPRALVIDFSRILMFAKQPDVESLNRHHAELSKQPGYVVFNHFALNTELLMHLRQIAVRIPLYLFTDGRLHELPEVASKLSGVFRRIVTVEALGHTKAQASAYESLAKLLGYTPGKLIFVDDKPANVAAAQAAGCQGHLYQSNDELIGYLETTV